MTRRIFSATLLATLGVLLATLLMISGVLYRYFTENQFDQLRTETRLVAQGIDLSGPEYFEHLDTSLIRVTWIDQSGQVLYDSETDTAKMGNHANRQEIKDALAHGTGESSRYSSTLTQRSLYTAKRLENGTVVRLSVTQHTILLLLIRMSQPIFLVVLVAVFLSVFLARRTANRLVAPINQLNLETPLENDAYEELSPLLRRIDHHQQEISQRENLLAQRQQEFDTITSRIKEGMILLNSNRQIISINGAAQHLFETDETSIGRDIIDVSRDYQLNDLVDKGLNGHKGEGYLEMDQAVFRVLARPVGEYDAVTGVVLLLFDITDQVQIERMRREFTANVSHELKTPLHVISGYSEMMANRLVTGEDVPKFAQKIYQESKRMIQLVEDIINLSHLDEREQVEMSLVDVHEVAEDVIKTLLPKADEHEISLNLIGQSATIKANPALLESIIYNLCDNAITYNHDGGKVDIRIAPKTNQVILEVEDNGIGMSEQDQSRIFERFYRIDKSRSKKVGGTGLGLSIVKHAVQMHDAQILVDSQEGKGTKMTMIFKAVK
ncbi:ATP-binding protein [Streptococcus tangpeifui]|uniref:sensor histidine kinase n=1 Tax=Streptococcus tangpeifui TaxID=2709400 RepID=UPI0013EAECEC|nr:MULTISPECIES: ATP-binding protein [unclassified Streptococcus]